MSLRCSPSSSRYFRCTIPSVSLFYFFFNDPATTELYTLSLHDALPISPDSPARFHRQGTRRLSVGGCGSRDRKSTRLNSSHVSISYAVFCLKKKKNKIYVSKAKIKSISS